MMRTTEAMDLDRAQLEASGLFAQSLGLPEVNTAAELVGTEEFLKFRVGRRAPVYDHALRETLEGLTDANPYRGLLGLQIDPPERFPDSMEANVLRGLLVRSTRPIAGQPPPHTFPGQYVPFQNNEETQAIQLVWANAGVPRDFLQMFSKSIEHARRAGRHKVELSDANLAIGELGRQKMAGLEKDAGNEQNPLKRALEAIEAHCLESDKKKVNAFLIRSESSAEYKAVQTLSDLRLLHILHQTITPHKAGERYEAYMLDYSLFTGFRQRRNIEQMLPEDGKQFKAKQLRKIPILPEGFLKSGQSPA